jgi:hypothetical protein
LPYPPPLLPPQAAETLGVRRRRFSPPTPPRRQGARPEARKEVRDPPASLVFVIGTSPDFATLAAPRRRAKHPRRRVSTATTALDRLAASRASRRRNPRLNLTRNSRLGFRRRARRHSPPVAATGQRTPPPHRLRAFRAVGLRSDAPVRSHRPQAISALVSRSNGSRSSQPRVNRSNPAGPAVLWKTPQVFRNSQIYPSTLEVFLQFSPFSLF